MIDAIHPARRLAILGLLAFAAPPAGAEEPAELALVSPPFYDVLHERATVAGALVVGFAAVQPSEGAAPQVDAIVPADWAGDKLCLRAISRDGLYESYNSYAVPTNWDGGLARLPYPTLHADLVGRFKAGEVAASVRRGSCDAPDVASKVALALWNASSENGVSLLVNSFDSSEAFLMREGAAPLPCERLGEPSGVAFDMSCEIPPEALGAELVLLTFKDGVPGDELALSLTAGFGP